MANVLLLGKDRNGNVDYSTKFSSESYQIDMSAGDTPSLAVPSGYRRALITIEPGSSVYVGLSAVPASTGSFAKTGAKQNPALLQLEEGDTLYFRAINDAEVGVEFYRI